MAHIKIVEKAIRGNDEAFLSLMIHHENPIKLPLDGYPSYIEGDVKIKIK